MNYGIPYKGSKNKLATRIVELLPSAPCLVDLFAGGCAVTHAAILSGKFGHVIANDINPAPITLFMNAVNGVYSSESRWITREDFFRLKDSDPYVRYCWSFGNNGFTYLYSKEVEPWKKAIHFARVFGDFSIFESFGINTDASNSDIIAHEEEYKQLYISWYTKNIMLSERLESLQRLQRLQRLQSLERLESLQRLQRLQRLQSLERLQRLQSLQSLQRLQSLSMDYASVPIPRGSVIYCDPPYKGTEGYDTSHKSTFDYSRFYSWLLKQKETVVISEYSTNLSRRKQKNVRKTIAHTGNAAGIDHPL